MPWCGAFGHPNPVDGPVTVMFRSGLVRASKDAAALRWGWGDTSELAQIVAYRAHVSAPDDEANGASLAAETPRDPWPAIGEIGERLARLDRERLEELKRLRQDVDDLTLKAESQVYVNTDTHRRLGELEKALGTLLATKEPPPDELFPTAPRSMVAAARTLVSMGYTWKGGQLWDPPLGKPPQFFGDSEGGAP